MKVDAQIIDAFGKLQISLPDILRSYGITKKFIYTNIEMSRSTFDRKIKEKTFTVTEMKRIAELIN
ncbi:hypothetical protein [Chondrinema litorale]|uniref:hypothetical protein n=1 Tax=Chondrinema litorale TaxID=2994555 RepID=UPI002543DE59|nr:hypothetical protein [Chondrinema litorale]UZR98311.1 hypothetical protein OQ292_30400 [Chondrinema litorale]